jgi:hypothetical protein
MIDADAVRQYCHIVFADPVPGSFVALRGLPEKRGGGSPHLLWIDADDPRLPELVIDFVETCSRRGIAAYCIPGFVSGRGRAGAADVVGMSTVVIDLDHGEVRRNIDAAASTLGNPSLVVRSGGRLEDGSPKLHAYWSIRGARTVAQMVELRGRLARTFDGDGSFDGRPQQPIRVAGSIHRKEIATPVSLAYANDSNWLHISQLENKLPRPPDVGHNRAPANDSNGLGFTRKVSLDDLAARNVGHGDPEISRFEALTRMIGTLLANLHDPDDPAEVEREFEHLAAWARKRVENVERDYNLRQHWRRLLSREKAKRIWKARQPRRATARRR